MQLFDGKLSIARQRYRQFVKKGISEGRRPDLVGGGLLRSAGGWAMVKAMRRSTSRMKGDERILGEGDFVETVLKAAQETLDRKYHLESRGYSFERLIKRVAKLFEISPKELLSGGKHGKTVKARSVVCYWGNRELGMSTIDLSKKMNISQPTASQSVVRGQKIVDEEQLQFSE